MDTDSHQVRLGAIGIVAVSLFLVLFVRLWFLQGIERQDFEATSVSNRLRVIQTEGPRGRILDRNGKVIVDNRTSVVVALDREPLREMVSGLDEREEDDLRKMREQLDGDFTRIAEALTSLGIPMTADDVWDRFSDKRYSPQEPVPVAEDVGPDVEQYLVERAEQFPGVIVERRAVREYPYGLLAAHVIGYVGEINDEELVAHGGTIPGRTGSDGAPGDSAQPVASVPEGDTAGNQDEQTKPYELGDSIGKTGVERAYEDDLRAVPGERTIEVNAKGELLDVVSDTPPIPGDDVWLTVDIDLQAQAERVLAEQVRSLEGGTTRDGRSTQARQGSAVVTDPVTGEVRAMASYPTYNPADLVNGIPTATWQELQDPASGLPLNNWAMQGMYAPGSTFKPVTALAGMRTGFLAGGNDVFVDRGSYTLQNCKGAKCSYRNAGGSSYGTVDVPRSLTVSSDAYYYRIGEGLWQGRGTFGETAIQDVAEEFGLGSTTGIEISGEAAGRIPTPQRRREAYEANPEAFEHGDWYTGDNVITAIGQGDVLVTPLQLANMYGTLANGGAVMRPHVVWRTTRTVDATLPPGQEGNFEVVRTIDPTEVRRVGMDPSQYIQIFEGLLGVTQDRSGTAAAAWAANPTAWPFAGKTGTAEVRNKADTSLFAGWGPAVSGVPPEYAISVVIPESGFGSEVAAPLAFQILAPASDGSLLPACPVLEPEATECREAYEAALAAYLQATAPPDPALPPGDAATPGNPVPPTAGGPG